MNIDTKKDSNIFILDLLGFLFYFQVALPIFINSNFLASFLPEGSIGLVYIIASVVAISFFFLMPRFLGKIGNFKMFCGMIILQIISLLTLTFSTIPLILVLFFIITSSIVSLLYFNFDIFLEHDSEKKSTGEVRGTFLTVKNLALVMGPLVTSFILTNGDYWKVYLAAAFVLIPMLLLSYSHLKSFKDKEYRTIPVSSLLRCISGNHPMRNAFFQNVLIQIFFAWNAIYLPLYLHKHLGFSWSITGLLFALSLLPYIFLEIPMGKLSDNPRKNKSIMASGFLLLAIINFLISLLSGNNLLGWSIIIFLMGVGAALVEVASETEFFKMVSEGDTETISLFRTMRPFSYILTPLIASILFLFMEIRYSFIILALLMLVGLQLNITELSKKFRTSQVL